MRNRARGNKRAAIGQRDTASVVINVQKTFQIPIPEEYTSNAIAINIWSQLETSNIYNAYSAMYDQVKMTGITAKIRGLNGSSALTLSNNPTICTAWDRNGLDNTGANAFDSSKAPLIVYNDLTAYSSSVLSNWSPGNAFKVTRHLYPSTLAEKSYYVSTGALKANSSNRDPSFDFLTRDGQPFKPILLIGAYCGFNTSVPQAIGFMIEFDISVVFRGLRRTSYSVHNANTQVLAMAGEYLNGANGEIINLVDSTAWTRVNNDGNIQLANGQPLNPIPTEVPNIKVE